MEIQLEGLKYLVEEERDFKVLIVYFGLILQFSDHVLDSFCSTFILPLTLKYDFPNIWIPLPYDTPSILAS